jgi:hypothetical protein
MTITGIGLLGLGIAALVQGDSHGLAGVVFGCFVLVFAALDVYVLRLLGRRDATPSQSSAEAPPGE